MTLTCWNTKPANHQGRTNTFLEEFGQWHKGESPFKSNTEALLPRSFYWMSEVKPSFSSANSKNVKKKKKKNSSESSEGEGLKSHPKPDRALN